jgi:hypothetical protein
MFTILFTMSAISATNNFSRGEVVCTDV